MYVPEFKPAISTHGISIDNISPDGKCFFIEDGHKYYSTDDIKDGNLTSFNQSKYKYKSPTGIIGEFYEHFDSIGISERYVVKHGLDITAAELRAQWEAKAAKASDQGSMLHALGESLLDGWKFGDEPDLPQTALLKEALAELKERGWVLDKTELLVYSNVINVAGQVDLMMKDSNDVKHMLDYKFLSKPLAIKSFYNPRTKKYKMMQSLFKHLHDSNFYHYSIQLSLYTMLMKVKPVSHTLVVVQADRYDLIPTHPIKLWVSPDGILHAKYNKSNGKPYDSTKDKAYLKAPYIFPITTTINS
ncbi:MAG: hypothetical protein KAH32_06370 [Chlamydiia bacterium]|nr:hypothetical protein [Chlamydiia bacterium]